MARKAVIIGAGISGILTGLLLMRHGWKVTFIEARHIGAGSSSRTAAGIRQQFSTPQTVLGMRYSVDFYNKFNKTIGGSVSPIVQNGYLFLLDKKIEEAKARVKMQQEAGLSDVEFLSAEETTRRFPFVDQDMIKGATWCPSDGFLRPGIVYGEAAQAVQREGGIILQNAPVNKIRIKNGKVSEIRAGDMWVSGDLFFDCTNAWSPRLAGLMGAYSLPINPVKRYLWFIDRGDSYPEEIFTQMPMVITPSGAYCRPENKDSLMVGRAHKADSEPSFDWEEQDEIEADFSHTSGLDSKAFEAWEEIASVLPPIADFDGITSTTSGYYGTTPDHNPFMCYDPYRSNLVHLVGFSGHGAMFGPFTALVGLKLAEAGKDIDSIEVLDGRIDMAAFAINRELKHAEDMVI